MILGFKLQFPWGKPTHFVEKIKREPGYRPKLHTLRKGKRWRVGMKIHFATGVRTKNYVQFAFGLCTCVQDIKMIIPEKQILAIIMLPKPIDIKIIIDDRELTTTEKTELALNDGFDSLEDFYTWFQNEGSPDQIVHWTPGFKY
jgi:hypothetical protein